MAKVWPQGGPTQPISSLAGLLAAVVNTLCVVELLEFNDLSLRRSVDPADGRSRQGSAERQTL